MATRTTGGAPPFVHLSSNGQQDPRYSATVWGMLAEMEQRPVVTPWVATVAEAVTVARLLDAFNREYRTPTPGPAVLATRLRRLLAGTEVIVLLAGDPALAIALVTLRPNVWYEGPVALLDELYVVPELRGRGLGSALLRAAEAITRQRGGGLLEINVDGQDMNARRFYERHGYTNIEPGQDQPLLYYYRELTDGRHVLAERHRDAPQSDRSPAHRERQVRRLGLPSGSARNTIGSRLS